MVVSFSGKGARRTVDPYLMNTGQDVTFSIVPQLSSRAKPRLHI